MRVILIYALAWVGLVILAIVNGTVRVKGYGPFMSELAAHQVSTAIGTCLFACYIWFLTGIIKIPSSRKAWVVGVTWLFMTVVFEFLFGHYVAGHPWTKLFEDYNILQGKVWILVLLWTTIAPYVFYTIRSRQD